MPATAEALDAEREYARALSEIRRRISIELARLTIELDPDDLSAAIDAFAPVAARLVTSGQVEAQQAASTFVASYITAEGGTASAGSIAPDIAGANSEGTPLARLLGGSLASGIFAMLRAGHPPRNALQYAAHAAARLAAAEVTAAADREIAHQAEDARRIEGWLWVLTGAENCAACLARANGRLRSLDEPFPRHPHCDCIRSIRLTGDPQTLEHPTGDELFRRMTPEQQARQFRTAGEEKAELVRSGQYSLADMVDVERHANWRAIVTEKSLAAVTGS